MKKSILKINELIQGLEAKKAIIQERCKHVNVRIEHCGDTGNYDPSEDRYWRTMSCPDCGKYWEEDE